MNKLWLMKKSILKHTLLIAWLLLIFLFSSQGHAVSHGQSEGARRVVSGVVHVMPSEFVVRKAAHTFLYMVLGALMLWVVSGHGWPVRRAVWISILLCGLYAVSDEVHQLLVPGRGPLVTDVVLDTTAAAVGTMIYYVIDRKVRHGHETIE